MKAEILVNTSDIDKEEWLKYRKKGIGGSDAAAIAGLDPYKSPISVYLEKIGQLDDIEDNERMRIGRDLEDYVARRFAEASGEKVRRKNAVLKHPEHHWMLGNIDRLIVGKNEGLECKVTNSYAKGNWEKDIPVQYEIQCHHYMAITGYEAWWIAALIGNEKFIYKKIEKDKEIENYLITIEKKFWENNILQGNMPSPDGSQAAKDLIRNMYPDSIANKTVDLSKDELVDKLRRRDELVELIKKLEKEINEIDQEIQLKMGEAEKAYIYDRSIIWKKIEGRRFNSKDFKKDHPELYKKYMRRNWYRRFLVK